MGNSPRVVQVWRDPSEVPPGMGATVVTVGNFDGVHLGHQHVLREARARADDRAGAPVVAVTFDPHPLTVIAADHAPQRLTTIDQRVALLADAGVDAVLIVRFTPAVAAMSAENFVRHVLLDTLHAVVVVVGENFRFGYRALGNVALLRTLCAERGTEVDGLPLDGAGGQTWSSSYIRQSLAAGDVAAAATALGRPFSISGYVVRGDQRGRELGYPTANVPVSITRTAVPADGVYAGWLRRQDQAGAPFWPAAISVGTNPTFDGRERRVEAYVLDRTDLELYGCQVEVVFVEHLRSMVTFDSIEGLLVQMHSDVDTARRLLVTPPA